MYGGESLLARSARLLIDAGLAPRVVVLAAAAEAHREALAGLDVEIALNPAPEQGISSSIRVGLRAVRGVDGAVITVCDQPFCTAEHLKLLVETARVSGAQIVASGYADVAGVPAFFRSSVFSRLENLTGNRGAATVIRGFLHGDSAGLRVVPFPEGAIDIDATDDLARLF